MAVVKEAWSEVSEILKSSAMLRSSALCSAPTPAPAPAPHEDIAALLLVPLETLHGQLGGKHALRSTLASKLAACAEMEPCASALLAELLRAHSGAKDQLLLRAATSVARDLAADPRNAEQARVFGLKRALMQVARDNADDLFVLDNVRFTFTEITRSVTTNARNQIRHALEIKDLNRLFKAMFVQPRNADTQCIGMDALFTLCKNPTTCSQLLHDVEGGFKPLLLVLTRFRTVTHLQVRGFQVLALLAKSSQELCVALGRAGAVQVIAANLASTPRLDRRQVQTAVWALNAIGRHPKNAPRLELHRVGLALRRAQRVYIETQHIQALEASEMLQRSHEKRRNQILWAQQQSLTKPFWSKALDKILLLAQQNIQVRPHDRAHATTALAATMLNTTTDNNNDNNDNNNNNHKQLNNPRLVVPLRLKRLMVYSEEAHEHEALLHQPHANKLLQRDDEEDAPTFALSPHDEQQQLESDQELELVIEKAFLNLSPADQDFVNSVRS
jgi:hypothetical protein